MTIFIIYSNSDFTLYKNKNCSIYTRESYKTFLQTSLSAVMYHCEKIEDVTAHCNPYIEWY